MLAFFALYAIGYLGWELFLLAFFGGLALAVVFGGPLDRVIPPRLEPYEVPFWALPSRRTKGGSVLGLSDDQNASGKSQNIEAVDQTEPKKPPAR